MLHTFKQDILAHEQKTGNRKLFKRRLFNKMLRNALLHGGGKRKNMEEKQGNVVNVLKPRKKPRQDAASSSASKKQKVEKRPVKQWFGRSFPSTPNVFKHQVQQLLKKKGITKPLFVDYGSGEGDVLEFAKNMFGADVLGFEFRENAVKRANEKMENSTMEIDLVGNQRNAIRTIRSRMLDNGEINGVVHYVYDGGIYPKSLSNAILNIINDEQRKSVPQIVCVVLSTVTDWDFGKTLTERNYTTALKTKFRRNDYITFETCDCEEEHKKRKSTDIFRGCDCENMAFVVYATKMKKKKKKKKK